MIVIQLARGGVKQLFDALWMALVNKVDQKSRWDGNNLTKKRCSLIVANFVTQRFDQATKILSQGGSNLGSHCDKKRGEHDERSDTKKYIIKFSIKINVRRETNDRNQSEHLAMPIFGRKNQL